MEQDQIKDIARAYVEFWHATDWLSDFSAKKTKHLLCSVKFVKDLTPEQQASILDIARSNTGKDGPAALDKVVAAGKNASSIAIEFMWWDQKMQLIETIAESERVVKKADPAWRDNTVRVINENTGSFIQKTRPYPDISPAALIFMHAALGILHNKKTQAAGLKVLNAELELTKDERETIYRMANDLWRADRRPPPYYPPQSALRL